MKDNYQIKIGMLLSYLLILCNAIYGFVITPYIISCLGEAEYGVYKTIGALANSLIVLDIGLGSTVMRYVAKYKSDKEEYKIPQFLGMGVIQAILLCVIIALVSVGIFFTIRPTYSATFTYSQIHKAQLLFVIFCVNMLIHVWSGFFTGIIKGYNNFAYVNGMQLVFLLLRASATFILLKLKSDSLVLVLLDTCFSIIFIALYATYIYKKTHVVIRINGFDMRLFFESGKYTLLSFVVSLAYQIGGNLDNVVIGALRGPAMVTVYSIGLLIYNMFQNLSMAISSVLLPTVSNVLANDDTSGSKIKQLIVRVGRLQFSILGAVLVGFLCIGKDFITIWLGNGFDDVYLISLILIIPSMFELCVSLCLAVLRAKNQMGFFAATMCGAAIFNAIVTIASVKYFSYIGAAVGTAFSVILGNLIVMNIYFRNKLKLPMMRIYSHIFRKIWICLLVSGVVLKVTSHFMYGSILALIANVCVFSIVYAILLWTWGLDKTEKQAVPVLNRFVK